MVQSVPVVKIKEVPAFSMLKSCFPSKHFEILAKSENFVKIYTKYNDVVDYSLPLEKRQDDGKSLAIFNSSNYLEISIYRSNKKTVGSASSLLGLEYRDTVKVLFK